MAGAKIQCPFAMAEEAWGQHPPRTPGEGFYPAATRRICRSEYPKRAADRSGRTRCSVDDHHTSSESPQLFLGKVDSERFVNPIGSGGKRLSRSSPKTGCIIPQ